MANIQCKGYRVPLDNYPYPFDFEVIYEIARKINETCPEDPRLFRPYTLLLKDSFVHWLTNSGTGWARHNWTPYRAGDILQRFLAWKAPLLQLVFQFPRAPFGLTVETFTLLHLLGDPIDTIASLLFTLTVCQERAQSLQHLRDNEWKAFTLIMLSLEECGEHDTVAKLEEDVKSGTRKLSFNYELAANALAADRSTSLLPVVTAELIFLASYAISFVRAFKSPFNPKAPWHLDVLAISFSFSYVWAIPAVLLGALIGVTQSELAVPRILRPLKGHTDLQNPWATSVEPVDNLETNSICKFVQRPDLDGRLRHGGIPSWRPDKWATFSDHFPEAWRRATRRSGRLCLLSVVLVGLGTIAGLLLSSRTPPGGFGCRTAAELTVFSSYLASFMFQYVLAKLPLSTMVHFRMTMIKDVLFAGIVASVVLTTQLGILNRPDCWSHWGREGVWLPQITKDVVEDRLKCEYPLVIFLTVVVLFGICGFIGWSHRLGLRVYLQRDDGRSNARAFDYSCRNTSLTQK